MGGASNLSRMMYSSGEEGKRGLLVNVVNKGDKPRLNQTSRRTPSSSVGRNKMNDNDNINLVILIEKLILKIQSKSI